MLGSKGETTVSATISVGCGEMPAIGLGLWKISREETAAMVRSAMAEGYRHLDSAADYSLSLIHI